MSTIHVFVSYSHLDEDWVKSGTHGLIPWLTQQLKRDDFEIWHDHALRDLPGADYKKLIKSEIDSAHMAILLISQDFVSSDFIQTFELPWIRERVDQGALALIPILVGPTVEDDLGWLADRQMLPGRPTPLIEYTESTVKWQLVRVEILKAIRKCAREISARIAAEPTQHNVPQVSDVRPDSSPNDVAAIAEIPGAMESESDGNTENRLPETRQLTSPVAPTAPESQPRQAASSTSEPVITDDRDRRNIQWLFTYFLQALRKPYPAGLRLRNVEYGAVRQRGDGGYEEAIAMENGALDPVELLSQLLRRARSTGI